MPGSCHDSSALKLTTFWNSISSFIDPDEYCLPDTAYPNSWNIVTPYARRNGKLTAIKRQFNARLSSIRVSVENCIGIMKERFPSIKRLPVQISSEDDLMWANKWIVAIMFLHNFCIEHKDENIWIPNNEADDDDVEEDEGLHRRDRRQQSRRDAKIQAISLGC